MNGRRLCFIFFLDVFVNLHIGFGKSFIYQQLSPLNELFHRFRRDGGGEGRNIFFWFSFIYDLILIHSKFQN